MNNTHDIIVEGGGLMSFIKSKYEAVKDVFRAKRGFSNTAQNTINHLGNQRITKVVIMRSPVEKPLMLAMDAITNGKMSEGMLKSGYDKMFHLSLLCVLENTQVICEKIDIVNISNQFSIPANVEYCQTSYSGNMTLNQLLETTINRIGNEQFFVYDGFNGKNCQNFVRDLLVTLNCYHEEQQKFVFQNMDQILASVPKWFPFLAKKITDVAQITHKLIGSGVPRHIIARKHYNYYYGEHVTPQNVKHWLDTKGGSVFFAFD